MAPEPPTPTRSNSHPYAIVTTSTALLTRSNTTNGHGYRHNYSPTPPSKHAGSHANIRREDRSSHRHSRSLVTFPLPPPLPSPPKTRAPQIALSDDESLKDGLSDDPKFWSSTHLANDLISAGAPELAGLVGQQRVSSRSFLKVSPSTELPEWALGLSDDVLSSIFEHARRLRLASLKARIWDLQVPLSGSDVPQNREPESPSKPGKVKHLVRALEDRVYKHGERQRTMSFPTLPSEGSLGSQISRAGSFDSEDGFASSSENGSDSGGSLSGAVLATPKDDTIPAVTIATPPMHSQEPSMESLLSNSPPVDTPNPWGAKAWEEDLLVATARRIPFTPAKSPDAGEDVTATSLTGLFHPEYTAPMPESDHSSQEGDVTVEGPISLLEDEVCEPADQVHTPIGDRQTESMSDLHAKVAQLEMRIKELEAQTQTPSTPFKELEPEHGGDGVEGLDLPQYLLMAGMGICAIVGQAVLRKLAGSRL